MQLQKTWSVVDIEPKKIDDLAKYAKIPELLAKILLFHQIGGDNIKACMQFLHPKRSLNKEYRFISDPNHLNRALNRLAKAIQTNEKIFINGDSDADGTCGASILVAGLRGLGADVDYDFPIRPREGHGIQMRLVNAAVEAGARVFVTTDCGTKDVEAVAYANSKGLDVIISDHHILGKELPAAYAVVNPYLVSSPKAEKYLSGAGVAFKLMVGLSKRLKQRFPKDVYEFMLAMGALGTVSDRVSMREPVNRALVSAGIVALNRSELPGLRALKEISVGNEGKIRARDISRTIAPRLNAPGRIGDPDQGIPDSSMVVDLLLVGLGDEKAEGKNVIKKYIQQFLKVVDFEKTMKKADLVGDKAEIVEEVNEKRKKITEKIASEIEQLLKTEVDAESDRVVIIRGKGWNSGVIGIDADRLRDRFLRPAIIATAYDDSPYLKGSVRSIPKVNMYKVLETVQEKFEKEHGRNIFMVEVESGEGLKFVNAFGGHSQACGFTLHERDYDEFVRRVREEMEHVPDDQFSFSFDIIERLKFSQVRLELIHQLDKLAPFGEHFDSPLFMLEKCLFGTKPRPFGNKYQENRVSHVEFVVMESEDVKPSRQHRSRQRLMAVGFGLWEKYQTIVTNSNQDRYDIVFTIEDQKPRGRRRGGGLRLLVQDIRRS